MFTGIVQTVGTVISAAATSAGKRLTVSLGELAKHPIALGDSVCVSGVCLTAVDIAGGNIAFDVITETLQRSSLGGKNAGGRVNLELSLRPDSYLGGHFVQGHVDAVAAVANVQENSSDWRITFRVPKDVMRYLVPKGSVAVDGVSMTIAGVGADTFTLAVIPTTLERTTLGSLRQGDAVNVETDILAHTVVHWLELSHGGKMQNAGGATAPGGITLEKLRELGMT